jgi:hypothetical protein
VKTILAGCITIILLASAASGATKLESISCVRTNYHGWNNAWVCGNGIVEAIVVPAIGRVMQFRFAGNETGPFWENSAMNGKSPDPKSGEWGNFGGDKSWPSPQSDWPKVTPRGWPPPVAFDSMAVLAARDGDDLVLTSSIDPHYGIKTVRRISVKPGQPVMEIKTTYQKVSGNSLRSGIWTITQLKDPVSVLIPIPSQSPFEKGYSKQSDDLPAQLRMQGQVLQLRRDSKKSTKIGTTADMLIWVGDKEALKIDCPRIVEGEYPDEGSSAEVYTNPDPNAYVELELLAPLHALKPGSEIEQKSIYTLYHRKPGMSVEDFGREIIQRE